MNHNNINYANCYYNGILSIMIWLYMPSYILFNINHSSDTIQFYYVPYTLGLDFVNEIDSAVIQLSTTNNEVDKN